MAFCKVCYCGEKIVFERILGYPDNCPSCGRRLSEFLTYNEDDPRVAELIQANESIEGQETEETNAFPESENSAKTCILKLSNGKEINIPEDGCIIGRTEVGAEELAEFPSVSRQHIRVTPRRNVGVIIEDISKYGTLVDGQRIEKNTPVRAKDGSKITLCNLETTLFIKEANN